MKSRHPLVIRTEAWVMGLALLMIPRLPRRAIVALANGMGYLAFRFSRRERRVALANLETVYGASLSLRQRNRLALGSFRTVSLVALDFFWFSADTARRIRTCLNFDVSAQAIMREGPKIGIAAHFGNWEILGQAWSLLCSPLTSVMAPLRNAPVNRMVARMRKVTGQRVVEQKGAIRALLGTLRTGGAVALLLDQNTVPSEGGVFVEFFGLPAPISRAAEALHLKTGAVVAFAYCLADSKGDYTVYAHRIPPAASSGTSGESMTQAIARTMEAVIRQRPEQWMWMYKRWKFIPEGRSAEGYPFYARPIEPAEK